MDEMKYDILRRGGGLRRDAYGRRLQLPINVIGVLGCETPGGRAYRPGDVLSHHVGQTVEVLNTDAEGVTVLAERADLR